MYVDRRKFKIFQIYEEMSFKCKSVEGMIFMQDRKLGYRWLYIFNSFGEGGIFNQGPGLPLSFCFQESRTPGLKCCRVSEQRRIFKSLPFIIKDTIFWCAWKMCLVRLKMRALLPENFLCSLPLVSKIKKQYPKMCFAIPKTSWQQYNLILSPIQIK